MELGVYLTKAVEDVFDKMLKIPAEGEPGVMYGVPEPTKRRIAKVIGAIRGRHANAPNYLEKVTLKQDTLDAETLIKVLGDGFFGPKKLTTDAMADFAKLFKNTAEVSGKKKFEPSDPSEIKVGQKVEHEMFGIGTVSDISPSMGGKLARIKFDSGDIKNIDLTFKKLRVVADTKSTSAQEAKSVAMGLSEQMWDVLDRIDHPVGWALVDFARVSHRSPGQNVLAIRTLDIDKDRPDLMRATFVNGKRTTIPAFNLLKQYFGTRFDNLQIDEFVREYTRTITLASHEPGDVIDPGKFSFSPKDVRSTFISLVTETYPRGHEDEVVRFLGPGLTKDRFGNYYKIVGESPDVMFTSHLDTVSVSGKTKIKLISRMKDSDEIISSDGTTILGADDKAGVTVMLYMMAHGIPGVYYLFVGEESGGIGSGKVADAFRSIPYLRGVRKCVSFDRKNYFSVITQQMYEECCSEEFADALCAELGKAGLSMTPDPTGVFTDSANFIEHVPECTNVSVGYFNEHSRSEALNVSFLDRLAKACIRVNWAGLPVARSVGMDENLYEHWGDVLIALDDSGFHNEIKVKGDKNRLMVSLALDSVSFNEAYTDVQTLEYLFKNLRLEAKVTFDFDLIKFELQP